jgi:rhamnulokinase
VVHHYAAVDLGATSGRVIVGRLEAGRLRTEETGRFRNEPVLTFGPGARQTLQWDVPRLWEGVGEGLAAAVRTVGPLRSLGLDGWAVDHGLVDGDGALLGAPVHYRDGRTDGIPARLFEHIAPERHYAVTGVQVQPFNTVFQLVAAAGTVRDADRMLLIPDLFGCWLTGRQLAELTNASTTGLLDVARGTWSEEVVAAAEAAAHAPLRRLLPEIVPPGAVVGEVVPDVGAPLGLTGTEVVAVGSHDTASAVAAVPMGDDAAYISSGTWSLVGVELARPVLTEASRAANFTNELGVGGTVRYLRNVTGLWLLEQSLATWRDQGRPQELQQLLAAAADAPALECVVDVDDPAFAPPGDVPARIADAALRTGQHPPESPVQVVRAILDSLALAYRRAVRQASELSGRRVAVVHVVGGGSRNALLCRLTADATGLPVLAGPAEGTAMGNLLVQAEAAGEISGGLAGIREVVRASVPVARYAPSRDDAAWDRAEKVLHG